MNWKSIFKIENIQNLSIILEREFVLFTQREIK